MKKKVIVYILTVVCLLLAACGKSALEKWQEQYDLGQQYLLEENYEEAIVAFTAAIELDPKQANVYIGRGCSDLFFLYLYFRLVISFSYFYLLILSDDISIFIFLPSSVDCCSMSVDVYKRQPYK